MYLFLGSCIVTLNTHSKLNKNQTHEKALLFNWHGAHVTSVSFHACTSADAYRW